MAEEASTDKAAAMRIWDKLCYTNPEFTKDFDKGTFKGTSISPVYQIKKMTEAFGPVGVGWKFEIKDTRHLHLTDGTVMVFRDILLYIKQNGEWSEPTPGSGGDFIARLTKDNKIRYDDEGEKKALTDALTNAMTKLGMSADVHMGYFDDEEYKIDIATKFAEEEPWQDRDAKIFVWNLTGEIALLSSDKEIESYINSEIEYYHKLAPFLKEVVQQAIESRKTQIRNNITPQEFASRFVDVQHAVDWFVTSYQAISEFKSIDQLTNWHKRNRLCVEGLKDALKATKYLKEGRNPYQRITALIDNKNAELKQGKVAAQ